MVLIFLQTIFKFSNIIIRKKCPHKKKLEKITRKKYKNYIYQNWIVFFKETYLPLGLYCYINYLKANNVNERSEIIGLIFSIILGGLNIGFVALTFLFTFKLWKKMPKDKDLKEKFDVFLDSIREDSFPAACETLVYITIRTLFMGILLFLGDY